MIRLDNKIINKFIPKLLTGFILIGIIILFLKNALPVQFIQDDAFTALRYVKNFINGYGLVFNQGERVEGYTNFLWVIILSIVGFLSRDISLENFTQYLSLFFSIVLIILTFVLSDIFNENDKSSSNIKSSKIIRILFDVVPVIMLAFSTPLIYWGVSGMETTMFVSLLLLSIIFYLKGNRDKPNYPFLIVSICNSLLRPEGMIFFLLIILHKIITKLIGKTKLINRQLLLSIFDKTFIKEIIIYLIPLTVFLIFRLIYYGYPLPNTFYAKTEFTIQFVQRGIKYFLEFNKANLAYGLILVLPLVLFIYKKIFKKYLLLYLLIFPWILCVIIIGGDVLPIGRFFLPIMPLTYILFAKSIKVFFDLIAFNNKYTKYLSLSLLLILIIAYSFINYKKQKDEMMTKRSYEAGLVQKMKIYARWINEREELSGHVPCVAMSTIGTFSYYTNSKIIDLVGLTNSYIAHNPEEVYGIDNELPVIWKERHYNAAYVLKQNPDYIIFPAGGKPSAFAECALFVQKEFKENYYTQLLYSEELHQLLPIFTRKLIPEKEIVLNECNVKFVKHFIKANDYFLKMLDSNDKDMLKRISLECDSITYYCPQRKADALTIRGYSYYHAGKYEEAKIFLKEASDYDPFNAISRLYLKNIFVNEGNIKGAVELMLQIKKYSPDALPGFDVKF